MAQQTQPTLDLQPQVQPTGAFESFDAFTSLNKTLGEFFQAGAKKIGDVRTQQAAVKGKAEGFSDNYHSSGIPITRAGAAFQEAAIQSHQTKLKLDVQSQIQNSFLKLSQQPTVGNLDQFRKDNATWLETYKQAQDKVFHPDIDMAFQSAFSKADSRFQNKVNKVQLTNLKATNKFGINQLIQQGYNNLDTGNTIQGKGQIAEALHRVNNFQLTDAIDTTSALNIKKNALDGLSIHSELGELNGILGGQSKKSAQDWIDGIESKYKKQPDLKDKILAAGKARIGNISFERGQQIQKVDDASSAFLTNNAKNDNITPQTNSKFQSVHSDQSETDPVRAHQLNQAYSGLVQSADLKKQFASYSPDSVSKILENTKVDPKDPNSISQVNAILATKAWNAKRQKQLKENPGAVADQTLNMKHAEADLQVRAQGQITADNFKGVPEFQSMSPDQQDQFVQEARQDWIKDQLTSRRISTLRGFGVDDSKIQGLSNEEALADVAKIKSDPSKPIWKSFDNFITKVSPANRPYVIRSLQKNGLPEADQSMIRASKDPAQRQLLNQAQIAYSQPKGFYKQTFEDHDLDQSKVDALIRQTDGYKKYASSLGAMNGQTTTQLNNFKSRISQLYGQLLTQNQFDTDSALKSAVNFNLSGMSFSSYNGSPFIYPKDIGWLQMHNAIDTVFDQAQDMKIDVDPGTQSSLSMQDQQLDAKTLLLSTAKLIPDETGQNLQFANQAGSPITSNGKPIKISLIDLDNPVSDLNKQIESYTAKRETDFFDKNNISASRVLKSLKTTPEDILKKRRESKGAGEKIAGTLKEVGSKFTKPATSPFGLLGSGISDIADEILKSNKRQ